LSAFINGAEIKALLRSMCPTAEMPHLNIQQAIADCIKGKQTVTFEVLPTIGQQNQLVICVSIF